MTHLKIEQGGTTEYVSTAVITKLYQYAKEIKDYEDDPNNNFSGDSLVSLKGTLSAPNGYRVLKEWLESTFSPDLHITLDNYAIPFEDPNMVTYLNSIGVGSDGMVTEALAAAATVVANSLNTTVTKFNELRYFTNITLSRNGLSGRNSGVISFYNWTALLEVDISNFTSLGHDAASSWEDTFVGCTALTTVTASDKLVDIGHNAFSGCSNLTTISGLDGIITLHSGSCFYNCSSLTSNNFSNVLFKFGPTIGDNVFRGCSSLTSITLDPSVTTIPSTCFSECTNLATINGISNVTTIRESSSGWGVFRNCKALTSIDLSNCTSIGSRAFDGCSALTTVTGPAGGTIGFGAFLGCTNLTTIDLSNVTSISSNDSNNGAFRNCTSLTSIDLSNCTNIGNGTFRGCSSLLSVTDLSNCVTIGKAAFSGCVPLASVNIDWNNISNHIIQLDCFRGCTSLTSIGTNTNTITDIEAGAFYGCSSLTSIDLSNINWTSSSNTLRSRLEAGDAFSNDVMQFQGCTNLRSIGIHSIPGVTKLGMRAFYNMGIEGAFTFPDITTLSAYREIWNCPNITKLSFPNLVTVTRGNLHNVDDGKILGCGGLKILDLGSHLQTLGQNGFSATSNSSLVAIIINTTTVPSIDYVLGLEDNNTQNSKVRFFGNNNCKIYVPDAAVITYQSTYPFSLFASDILPMTDYNEAAILGTTT